MVKTERNIGETVLSWVVPGMWSVGDRPPCRAVRACGSCLWDESCLCDTARWMEYSGNVGVESVARGAMSSVTEWVWVQGRHQGDMVSNRIRVWVIFQNCVCDLSGHTLHNAHIHRVR